VENGSQQTASSATESVVFIYNAEIAQNLRVRRRFCAWCEPESASPEHNSANSSGLSPGAEKPVRFTGSAEIRSSIACVNIQREVALVDSDRLQLHRPFQRQIDPVEQGLGVELSRLTSLADCFDNAGCGGRRRRAEFQSTAPG
jgi:hypothetical protein